MDIFRITRHMAGGLILALLLSACGGRTGDRSAPQATPDASSVGTTDESGGPHETHPPDAAGAPNPSDGTDARNVPGTSDAYSPPDGTQTSDSSTTSSAPDPVPITLTESRTAEGDAHYIADSQSEVVLTLPTDLQRNAVVSIQGAGEGGWKLALSPGQEVNAVSLGVVAGATWTQRMAYRSGALAVASSADGRRLVAAGVSTFWSTTPIGQIFASVDGGITWNVAATDPASTEKTWVSIASAGDGTHLVAAERWGYVYTSENAGASWTKRMTDSQPDWTSVAYSADGTKLVAASSYGAIYTSINGGATWSPGQTTDQSSPSWTAVASSSDGTRLVGVTDNGQIYTSIDGGATWTASAPDPERGDLVSVASSENGDKLAAAEWFDPSFSRQRPARIYTSIDGGKSWQWNATDPDSAPLWQTPNWQSVASSSNGSRLVAAGFFFGEGVWSDPIYTSPDDGQSWTQNQPVSLWTSVASSSDGSRLVAGSLSGLFTSSSWTAPGPDGYISGGASDAIELIYLGDGMFDVLSHTGNLKVQ